MMILQPSRMILTWIQFQFQFDIVSDYFVPWTENFLPLCELCILFNNYAYSTSALNLGLKLRNDALGAVAMSAQLALTFNDFKTRSFVHYSYLLIDHNDGIIRGI